MVLLEELILGAHQGVAEAAFSYPFSYPRFAGLGIRVKAQTDLEIPCQTETKHSTEGLFPFFMAQPGIQPAVFDLELSGGQNLWGIRNGRPVRVGSDPGTPMRVGACCVFLRRSPVFFTGSRRPQRGRCLVEVEGDQESIFVPF